MNVTNALDTLIAVAVVILLLSLVVQAIQEGLKKLLRIKSRQLEDSLIDLLEHAVGKVQGAGRQRFSGSPLTRLVLRREPDEGVDPEVKALFAGLKRRLREIGRLAQTGREAPEDLSKDDLVKLVESLPYGEVMGAAFGPKEQALASAVGDLRQALAGVTAAGPAGAAAVPLSEAEALAGELADQAAEVLASKRCEDLTRLDRCDLAPLRSKIAALRAAAAGTPALAAAADALAVAAERLGAAVGRAAGPVAGVVGGLERWYDTMMRSFDERYARGMRTWAWVIALVVVILTNADFFSIYQRVKTDDVMRAQLMAARPEVNGLFDAIVEQAAEEAKKVTPAGDAGATQLRQERDEEVVKALEPYRQQVGAAIAGYSSFGFRLLRYEDIDSPSALFARMPGWAVMTLLLSVGAPFWKDALESLFGLKNLLRSKKEASSGPAGAG